MFQRTWGGYSFPEVLVCLALISFVVIIFSQMITTIDQQRIKSLLQIDLFRTAHSVASIIEDKTLIQIPFDLFLPANQTSTMTIAQANENFQISIPAEIIQKNQTVNFSLNLSTVFLIDYCQITVFANKEYHGHVIHGYATCFVK